MSSALPLIVLGHVYLLAPAVNTTPDGIGSTNLTSIPNVYQLSGPLPEATRQIGYTYIAGIGAYKFHNQAATWYTARLICREEGGSLAVINSQAESEAIARMFTSAGSHLDSSDADNEFAWLGFHDLFGGNGRYETVHNEYLENVGFNQWQNGNRGSFGSWCGNVFKNGLLNSANCGRYLAFVCELPGINTYMEQRKTDTLTVS